MSVVNVIHTTLIFLLVLLNCTTMHVESNHRMHLSAPSTAPHQTIIHAPWHSVVAPNNNPDATHLAPLSETSVPISATENLAAQENYKATSHIEACMAPSAYSRS